jgi:hypothetical protein
MGFNRRKMEDQRRQVAEKEAVARRATDAQVLEAAERLITAWNERQGRLEESVTFPPPHGDSISYGAGLMLLRPTHVRRPPCRQSEAPSV